MGYRGAAPYSLHMRAATYRGDEDTWIGRGDARREEKRGDFTKMGGVAPPPLVALGVSGEEGWGARP